MHGKLQTRDLVETLETKQPRDWPVLAMLAFGGVLTLAWMAFLLWTLIQILNWMIS